MDNIWPIKKIGLFLDCLNRYKKQLMEGIKNVMAHNLQHKAKEYFLNNQ